MGGKVREMRPAHEGRAFMEPDRRIWLAVSHAARIVKERQDKLMAEALVEYFEKRPAQFGYLAAELRDAIESGAFNTKKRGRPPVVEGETEEREPMVVDMNDALIAAAAKAGWPPESIVNARGEGLSDKKIAEMLGIELDKSEGV